MNPDDVLKLLVDFFQDRSYFDIAEIIADVKVDASWTLIPTRLESILILDFS
jgi:hypothetical protein